MNIYTQRFTAKCPNNSRVVTYTLTIESHDVIMVEDIQAHVTSLETGFHEALADQTFARFGGRQTIQAHHHGTDVTTVRP